MMDLDDVGMKQKWYEPARRPKKLHKEQVGRHWRTDQTIGELGPGWHFITFKLPGEHADKQVFLYFGSVDGYAHVYVNGKPAGTHNGNTATGWIEPFHFDVTKLVKAGDNDLAVRVRASTGLVGIYKSIGVVVK